MMPLKKDRITITLTPTTRKRLAQHCARVESLEGARVAPARVVNELILSHLEPHPDEQGEPQRVEANSDFRLVKTA